MKQSSVVPGQVGTGDDDGLDEGRAASLSGSRRGLKDGKTRRNEPRSACRQLPLFIALRVRARKLGYFLSRILAVTYVPSRVSAVGPAAPSRCPAPVASHRARRSTHPEPCYSERGPVVPHGSVHQRLGAMVEGLKARHLRDRVKA